MELNVTTVPVTRCSALLPIRCGYCW